MKLGQELNYQGVRFIQKRRAKRGKVKVAIICFALGILLGLGWGLISRRSHDVNNYCEQWDSSKHDYIRVVK